MDMHSILGMASPTHPSALGGSIFVSESFVGLEIEMEGVSSQAVANLTHWNRVSEGSISGYEIVLKKPKCQDELFLALCEIDVIKGRQSLDNAFSERTSVHVHVDIRDMTFNQMMAFITLSAMFEPVLYKYVAEHRSNNHFCWSLLDCQDLINRITKVYKADSTTNSRNNAISQAWTASATKYAGINLSSVPRYGSLEFRMHEGTANKNSIIRWINILLSIKAYCMERDNITPLNVLQTKEDMGIDSIFTEVLGGYKGILSYGGVEDDILKGIRSAQDFVHSLTERSVSPPTNHQPFNNLLATIDTERLTQRGMERRNA